MAAVLSVLVPQKRQAMAAPKLTLTLTLTLTLALAPTLTLTLTLARPQRPRGMHGPAQGAARGMRCVSRRVRLFRDE